MSSRCVCLSVVKKNCRQCQSTILKPCNVLFILIAATAIMGWAGALTCYECSSNTSLSCTATAFRTYDNVVKRDNCKYCLKTVEVTCILFYCEVSRSCVDSCEPGPVMIYNVTRARKFCCQTDLCNEAPPTPLFFPNYLLIMLCYVVGIYKFCK